MEVFSDIQKGGVYWMETGTLLELENLFDQKVMVDIETHILFNAGKFIKKLKCCILSSWF